MVNYITSITWLFSFISCKMLLKKRMVIYGLLLSHDLFTSCSMGWFQLEIKMFSRDFSNLQCAFPGWQAASHGVMLTFSPIALSLSLLTLHAPPRCSDLIGLEQPVCPGGQEDCVSVHGAHLISVSSL